MRGRLDIHARACVAAAISLCALVYRPVPSRSAPVAASRRITVMEVRPVPPLSAKPKSKFPLFAEDAISRSPDGRFVLLAGQGDSGDYGLGSTFSAIRVVDLTGKLPVWTYGESGTGVFVSDQELVFCVSGKDGSGSIRRLSLTDQKERRLYPRTDREEQNGSFWGASATWNARTGELAFTGGASGENPSIFVMRLRDRRVRRLITHGDEPRWSPEGRTLAYQSEQRRRPDESREPFVWTCRPDGTGRRRLARGRLIDWLPDRRRLLCWSPEDGGTVFRPVLKVDTKTGRVARLGKAPGTETLQVSPSGKWLGFSFDGAAELLDTITGERLPFPIAGTKHLFWGRTDEQLYFLTRAGWRCGTLEVPRRQDGFPSFKR